MNIQHIQFSDYWAATEIENKNVPKELYYLGDFSLLTGGRKVSVVGSEKATGKGLKLAEFISRELVKKSFVVVSGLAAGIETAAHKTAMENGGKTIAVLDKSLNQVYPAQNSSLFEEMASKHLAISQFPPDYPFQKKNLSLRNLTMALISDAIIIVKAEENSDVRYQVWEALRLGRRVLIMENMINDTRVTWAKKMLNYGAEVLTTENRDHQLSYIPYLTEQEDIAF